MGLATAVKNVVLEHLLGKVTQVDLGNETWLALSTANPTADGSGIAEPSGNGYGRVLVGNSAQPLTQKFGSAAGGVITNIDAIMMPEATGAWGTITHFALFTAESGGTFIGWGALTASIAPVSGDVPLFRAGQLTWTLADS